MRTLTLLVCAIGAPWAAARLWANELLGLAPTEPVRGRWDAPHKASSASEAAARVEGAALDGVDWTTTDLLIFGWQGSGQDGLACAPGTDSILCAFRPGMTRDLRPHFHVYTVPRNSTIEYENKGFSPKYSKNKGLSRKKHPDWSHLVGVPGDEARDVLSTAGIKTVQVLPIGSPVTMDYRLDRVRIYVDKEGKVVRAPTVG